ncbi:Z1 domain-containing protein [Marinobacter salexigens]|uniref:Z1 domain-containing protein n=1 Tax=Marinobacter salexigens TaxID=1925763 RepID=UPI000C2903DD|nr:Z1 domain-containing protein [Marinobacter salexigens]
MSGSNYDQLMSVVESALFNQPRKTEEELRSLIEALANAVAPEIDAEERERLAREVEAKQGIKAGLGAVVDGDDFEPWLDDAKASIEPFYWHRYQKLLLQNGLPRDVVTSTDKVTDKILGRLGNPRKQVAWDRRGMVVGHVQSGKTANYTGLICKAADAGYRLIIVIAGIHNNLRNQTQARIDEGFIGRDTGRVQEKGKGGARYTVGVGQFDPNRTPVSLTNTLRDFNKETASTNTSEIDSYKVPVVLVIKKNHRTLANLLDWLRDNSTRGDREMIDQPMILIDDEADNASINTGYNKKLVTKINSQIRDLLSMFHRSCYVGYTATPFANIFIDPDQDDEMFNEDLFPRDFIIGLDAPTNYFGPRKLFIDGIPEEGEPVWLRYITDNEDILPVKHKIDHQLDSLPDSLIKAVRTFLLARVIRNLRGHASSHCSMLVNASRFTDVQGKLRNRIHETLEYVKNAARVNAARGTAALEDPEIAALYHVWLQEYSETEFSWDVIQKSLLESIASAKVVEVNSRANDLDYSAAGERGQTVIAVGGFSLSRGLTLEGLTVTWFLRNTMMYDTLMQMGRWFGYRGGYEDLCRVWMPPEAIDWYAFIANASEELHEELKIMEKAKATPKMFGLAVRSHPASLLVTARNKMGSGRKVTTMVGLSNRFIETAKVSVTSEDLTANMAISKSFVGYLIDGELEHEVTEWGYLWRGVRWESIDQFLAGWRNAEQSVTTETGPVRKYIQARSDGELQKWDVLITSKKSGEPDYSLGLQIIPAERKVSISDPKHAYMSFSGKGMRLASRGIEKAGLAPSEALQAEESFRLANNKNKGDVVNYPDKAYRQMRTKGLFILHLVQPKKPAEDSQAKYRDLIPQAPVVGWGISLPVSSRPTEKVEYVVNTVRYTELFGDEDEDQESEYDEP